MEERSFLECCGSFLRTLFLWFLWPGAKLDSRFDYLLKNKESLNRGNVLKDLERDDMKLDKHLVVTSKGAQTMYSCIIYTKNPENLNPMDFWYRASCLLFQLHS